MSTDPDSSFERAAALIAQADALLVAAGAGMGVDSGLPDFRGAHGFWNAYPALGRLGIDFYSIACPAAFRSDPTLAWGFYGHRLALYRRTVPHAGFALLHGWGRRMARGSAVFTSNVDGQFQRAGFDAEAVHECHGSIAHLQCIEDCSDAIWPADDFHPEVDEEAGRLRNALPRCPHCGALARPNVLMFGDAGWNPLREQAQAARMRHFLHGAGRLVVVEVGAGTAVPSVRNCTQQLQQTLGARLVRINPRESAVASTRDVGLACAAGAALETIATLLPGLYAAPSSTHPLSGD
ncbi:Sir2 family NAD-dependent protein deacetylase [Pseudorhodoferax sp. Leaf267]|uniref:SIR2 family NAD-dependent protein deacylase n=1 Tax=Pseudorhodoferax sp. Leaf267 TaxID=1736316 RepID=UPI0006F81212|nr:Sir2 family NAD-dependent protein deacetylase [Pseudorhodoferax sp. Leaf267]KQP23031.1 NAD-dependent deacetylase [Pseudorhodoferax sp. Leaf267]